MKKMMKLRNWMFVVLAFSFYGSIGAVAQVELVDNGDFESPTVPAKGWEVFGSAGDWTPINGVLLELQDGSNSSAPGANTGSQFAELHAEPATNNGITQDITTEIGKLYKLTYAHLARTDAGNEPKEIPDNDFIIEVKGNAILHSSGAISAAAGWTTETIYFTADSTVTTISFDVVKTDTERGVFIDSVSVTEFGWSGELDLVVGNDINYDDDVQMESNASQEDDGGVDILVKQRVSVMALVPDGMNDDPGENARIHIAFNLPTNVVVFDADGVELEGDKDEWGAEEGSKQYWIEAEEPVEQGQIHLYASDFDGQNLDPSQDFAYVNAECPDCQTDTGGSCEINPFGSLNAKINLGQIRYGESAGFLTLRAETFSTALASPASLMPTVHEDLIIAGLASDGGSIKPRIGTSQHWGEMIVNTTPISGADYALSFYTDDDGDTNTAAILFRTVEVTTDAANKTVRIEETQTIGGGTTTRYWDFTYDDTNGHEWLMEEGAVISGADDPIKVKRALEVTAGTTMTKTMTTETPGSNTVIQKIVETWEEYDWGQKLTQRVTGSGTNSLTEQWEYYTNSADDGYRQLKWYISGTGYWEGYVYTDTSDEIYRSQTVMQLDNNTRTSSDPADTTLQQNNILHEEYRLTPSSYSISRTDLTTEVRYQKFTTTVANKLASTTFVARTDGDEAKSSGKMEIWQAVGTVAAPVGSQSDSDYVKDIIDGTATNCLVTKTTLYALQLPTKGGDDSQPGDINQIEHPDGQVTLFTRDKDADDNYVTVTKHGYLNAVGGTVLYGSQITQTINVRGSIEEQIVERATQADHSGDLFVVSLMKMVDEDEFGRPTEIDYFFGEEAADEIADAAAQDNPDYTEYRTHGCCGSGSERTYTNRGGVVRKDMFDALGRMVESTPADGTISGDIRTEIDYDAADRVIQTTIKPTSGALPDLESKAEYDDAGRLTMLEDAEGRRQFVTYRRVSSSTGAAYTSVDPVTDAGAFYWEARVYGHDRASSTESTPAIRVAWTDSHGRTVRYWTASTTATWSQSSPPTGSETLTEQSRKTTKYPWVDWASGGSTYTRLQVERWAYHELPALSSDGTAATNYIVASKVLSDPAGRIFRSTDAAGNITENTYDDEGRVEETWIGVDTSDLHMVSKRVYKEFRNGVEQTANDRPWPGRTYTVKPGLDEAPDETDLANDYTYTDTVEEHNVDATDDYMTHRYLWSQPEHGPWSRLAYEEEGRLLNSRTYMNGDDTHELTRTGYLYHADSATPDGSNGKLEWTRQYRVTGGSATSYYLETRHLYDDAGRLAKVNNKGRGFTKTEYDGYGRTKRTAFGSYEGTTGNNLNFTDDTLLTETVPTYDKSGRVTGTATYERTHDATATGLLSAAAADQVRVTYNYAWYDGSGRRTHTATTGTTPIASTGYGAYNAASPPAADTYDDVLVSQVDFDDAGRAYLSTDNLGQQNRSFFDDLGRVTYSVKNWGNSLTTPGSPGSRDGDVNQITQYIYDNSATGGGARIELVAIDPDGDGNVADNQSTLYIHSGEVNNANNRRGYIPVNGRAIATVMPDAKDSGGGVLDRTEAISEINAAGEVFGDFSYIEYYANGQIERMTDQRGVQKNRAYTNEGWLDNTGITLAGGSTWTSIGDRRTAYTYGDAGETLTITTFDAATGGNETSKITYTYDGFYNRLTETQDHDPSVGNPQTTSYAYDTTLSGGYYANAYRLSKTTYPSGRVLHTTYDGHMVDGYSIDGRISRANALADDSVGSPGTPGDDIVSYSYLGSGRMVIKDLPTPEIKLDYFGGTSGTYAGLDQFGRPIDQRWVDYGGTSDEDLLRIAHGYDRGSRMRYADRLTNPGLSQAFTHDKSHRLDGFSIGALKRDGSGDVEITGTGIDSLASTYGITDLVQENHTLDQLHNTVAIEDDQTTNKVQQNINAANELEDTTSGDADRTTDPTAASPYQALTFQTSDQKDLFEPALGLDSTEFTNDVSVDSGDSNKLVISNSTTSDTNPAAVLRTDEHGPFGVWARVQDESASVSSGCTGVIFGYKSDNDYWLYIIDYARTTNNARVFHVQNGSKGSVIHQETVTATYGFFELKLSAQPNAINNTDLTADGGFPSGRVGLYTEVPSGTADSTFGYLRLQHIQFPKSLSSAWTTTTINAVADKGSGDGAIDLSNDTSDNDFATGSAYPLMLRGVHANRFEVTFSTTRSASGGRAGNLLIGHRGANDYAVVRFSHGNTYGIVGQETIDGFRSTLSADTPNAVPNASQSDTVWYRVTCDGTDVTVYAKISTTEPSFASSDIVWETNGTTPTDRFDFTANGGGAIGFSAYKGTIYPDNLTVKTDRDADGSYETTEHIDSFDLNSSDQIEEDLDYDASGNLTFDGVFKYSYDGCNRLVKAEKAYRDANDVVQTGSTVATYAYDGRHRRITRTVTNSGPLDGTFDYYYDGSRVIEEQSDSEVSGSVVAIKQHVWGLGYIDELIATDVIDYHFYSDPPEHDRYYAVLDTKYCVLGLVDEDGAWVQRYEYTPDGRRQVYTTVGSNDPHAQSPTGQSPRHRYTGENIVLAYEIVSSFALCDIGFQGLMHDEVTGNIYQRAREYSPTLARFIQRDPLGYPDGMNTYAAYHVLYGGVDPWGFENKTILGIWWDELTNPTMGRSREYHQKQRAKALAQQQKQQQQQQSLGACRNKAIADLLSDGIDKKKAHRDAQKIEEAGNIFSAGADGAEVGAKTAVKEVAIEVATGPVPSSAIRALRHTDELIDAGRAISNLADEGSSLVRQTKEAVEAASRNRLQQRMPNRVLSNSTDPAFDYVDDLGKTYDQMGNPNMIPHWGDQCDHFYKKVQDHIQKADYTVIDLTNFPDNIKQEVGDYLLSLPEEQFDKVIPLGF